MLEQTDWLPTELDESTSSLEGSRAPTYHLRGDGKVCQVSAAASGPSFTEYSLKFDPVGQSLKTSLGLELSEQIGCSLTWQEQVTPLGRWWWVLSMPERPIDDSGFGLLPTATSVDWKGRGPNSKQNGLDKMAKLGLLPTPQAYSHKDSSPPGTTPLDRMVRWGDPNGRMLPTPSATTYGRNKGGQNQDGPERPSLETMAKGGMLPTPRSADGMAGPLRSKDAIKNGLEKRGRATDSRLEDAIALQQDQSNGTGNGRLSLCFVEWMMGYSAGWTDVSD